MINLSQAEQRIEAAVEQVKSGLNRLIVRKLPPQVTGALIPLRGKCNRARLLLAFANLGGVINEAAFDLASGVELLHLASLVQDDIVDRSAYRQGVPAVNRVVGAGAAILLSDWLFGEAYHFFCRAATSDLEQINRLVKTMAYSELCQELAVSPGGSLSELNCLRYNYHKTALFFETSCRLGMQAREVGTRANTVAGKVGLWWGMAYQLHNDLQDLLVLSGDRKRIDQDRRRGLLTLPLVWLLQNRPELISEIWSIPCPDLAELLQQHGVLRQCALWYNRFLSKAERELERLPAEGGTKDLLGQWITTMRFENPLSPLSKNSLNTGTKDSNRCHKEFVEK